MKFCNTLLLSYRDSLGACLSSPPFFYMKSQKIVKDLLDILLPFSFTPGEYISGSVNGKKYYFQRGVKTEVSFSEYESLINAGYEKTLND